MDSQDKNTLLQFMGQVYGESKKLDNMLVSNLRPTSNEVKNNFERTLRSPVDNNPQPAPVNPAPIPQPVEPAQVPQPVNPAPIPEQVVTNSQQVPAEVQSHDTSSQLEFDLTEPTKMDKVIELLERQNKLLTNVIEEINKLSKDNNLTITNRKLSSSSNGKTTTRKG